MKRTDLLERLLSECRDARGRGFGEMCKARIVAVLDEIQRVEDES